MASVSFDRKLSECVGKDRFNSRTQAVEAMSGRIRKLTQVYHCATCKGWHIGNVAGSRVKRLEREKQERHRRHERDED